MRFLQHRYVRTLIVAAVGWTVLGASQLVLAETSRIPDAPRNWTDLNGRVRQLRYVETDGEEVVFQDAAREQTYRVPLDKLCLEDQAAIRGMTQDGSRVWTRADGRARRLRLIECDGVSAVFEIPNVGMGVSKVADFVEADRQLLMAFAKNEPAAPQPELAFVAYVQEAANAAPAPAAPANDAPAPQEQAKAALANEKAVYDALTTAFTNAELKSALDAIGSAAKFDVKTADGMNFSVTVDFAEFKIERDAALEGLNALVANLKPQVTQVLNIREADVASFNLTFALKTGDTPPPPPPPECTDSKTECETCCFDSCAPSRRCRLLALVRLLRCRRCCCCCWE